MANVATKYGINFSEAGGFDGPITVSTIVVTAGETAGLFTLRGTNAVDGPVLFSGYLAINSTVAIPITRGAFDGLYLSALPAGGLVSIIRA